MADEGEFPKANGDVFYAGDANKIGTFYVEATDSSGSDHTENAGSWTAARSFEFTGIDSSYVLERVELEDFTIDGSSTSGTNTNQAGVIVDDGTNYYTYYQYMDYDGTNDLIQDYYGWVETTSGSPSVFFRKSGGNPSTIDKLSLPVPTNMLTGVTTYNLTIYIIAGQDSPPNTITLTKGFTVRLVFKKLVQNLGTTVNQS